MYSLKNWILVIVFAIISVSAFAQSATVTGKVVDSEGSEVIGASVTVKGAAGVGTITDIDGNYTLKVNNASKDVLVFSFVGLTTKEVKVNNQNVINVTLQANAVLLDEVVAIGYATVKRKDLTGSVASVGSQELSKIPTSDVTQALAGRMAGVMIQHRAKVLLALLFLSVYVVVFLLLRAMNLCISSMVSLAKMVCHRSILPKLKQSTF